MTCSDDSAAAFVLDAAAVTAENKDDGWTPRVARIIAAIAQALDPFPDALAAVQAAVKRLRAESSP